MSSTRLRTALHRIAAALPHLLLHTLLGMAMAAVLGWLEVLAWERRSVNEFNGLYGVIAVWFTGPVACALAAPLHLWSHIAAPTRLQRHAWSLAAFLACYALVRGLLFAAT